MQFLSFFRDSAYFAEKKPFFQMKYVDGDANLNDPAAMEEKSMYNTNNYPSKHFYNLKQFEPHLPVPGYPVTFITDKNGIIRYVFNGGYIGIGADIERQVRLFQGFVPLD